LRTTQHLLTVDAARSRRLAISRIDESEAIPREISSRSARVQFHAACVPPSSGSKRHDSRLQKAQTPFLASQQHHLYIYIRWSCIDLSNAPVLTEKWAVDNRLGEHHVKIGPTVQTQNRLMSCRPKSATVPYMNDIFLFAVATGNRHNDIGLFHLLLVRKRPPADILGRGVFNPTWRLQFRAHPSHFAKPPLPFLPL
jgi:hypothetical protein